MTKDHAEDLDVAVDEVEVPIMKRLRCIDCGSTFKGRWPGLCQRCLGRDDRGDQAEPEDIGEAIWLEGEEE